MKNSFILVTFALTLLLPAYCCAQILCVRVNSADLLSSPSRTDSYIRLQVPRYYPLELLEERGDFMLVRDYRRRTAWVESSLLGPRQGVIVAVTSANLRSGPDQSHSVVFKARQGVTFRLLEVHDDWLKVEHENGMTGWIFQKLVWGR